MSNQEKWLFDLGVRIKSEREKQGLIQQALAMKANTKQDYIAQLERGTRNPSLRTFMNILLALEISADHLIFGVSNSCDSELTSLIDDFTNFMIRRKAKEVAAYYDIVRFMSKYIESKML